MPPVGNPPLTALTIGFDGSVESTVTFDPATMVSTPLTSPPPKVITGCSFIELTS